MNSTGAISIDVQYRPGLLVRALMLGHRAGLRFPRRFINYAMQHSGHVRLGTGPWLPVRPNLPLGRPAR